MNKFSIALAVSAAMVPGIALAGGGTCASPLEMFSDVPVAGDTADNGNEVGDIGGFGSAGPDDIYSFVAPSVATDPITLSVTGGFPGGVAIYLTTGCGPSIPVGQRINANGGDGTTDVVLSTTTAGGDQLTAGTSYFLIVTNAPGDNAGGSGTYNLTPGTLPVALQSFSID